MLGDVLAGTDTFEVVFGNPKVNKQPIPFHTFLQELPHLFLLGFFGGLIALIIQYFLLKRAIPSESANTSYICSSCNKVQNFNGTKKCKCGGDLEPFINMKWVEDKSID
jgi:hypothetical protein